MSNPLEIEILLHYGTGSVAEFPNMHAPAVQDAIKKFLGMDLLKEIDGKIEGNMEPLRLYISALREVPFPQMKWEMVRNPDIPPPSPEIP